jgi:hypothetical protein
MLVPDDNLSILLIDSTTYIQNLSFLVHKEWCLPSKHLPPSWVNLSGESNDRISTIGHDFQGKVLPVVGSDGLADWFEEELLILSVLNVFAEFNMSGTVASNDSMRWESWNDVEWSVDMESKVFIESFLWYWLSFVKIDDFPSLVCTIMSRMYLDICHFFIYITFDGKAFLVLIVDEVLISIIEDLPPLRVSSPDVHDCLCSCALNVPWFVV